MDTQLAINDQLNDRIEYLERKVYELIETVNVLVEDRNRMVEAFKEAESKTCS